MAVADCSRTTAPRRARSTPKTPQNPQSVAVLEHLEPNVHRLVGRALRALEKSAVYRAAPLSSPDAVRAHLQLTLAHLEHEEFVALWLDSQNRLIARDVLAVGTLTTTPVYPREVVKAGLAHNAGAVIFAHNHPSGIDDPSHADQMLTATLKAALATVDIKLLDHFIVAGTARPLSLAERGLV